jgi:hypothetical protein
MSRGMSEKTYIFLENLPIICILHLERSLNTILPRRPTALARSNFRYLKLQINKDMGCSQWREAPIP